MQNEIIIAGLGGQGVLVGGILIAQSAMEQGLHTTWFPSYGAEMRGGAANSAVIVSSEEIGSPLVLKPNSLILLNETSLVKFMPKIADNAVIIANSSLVPQDRKYSPNFYFVPLTEIADKEIKNVKTANMVGVGSLIKALEKRSCGIKEKNSEKSITLESALEACEKVFASKQKLIEVNKKAVRAGYDFIN